MFSITRGKGFALTFANGWTASVQWGAGNYCDNYALGIETMLAITPVRDSHTAEVAAFKGEVWLNPVTYLPLTRGGTDARGYVSADDVVKFLANVSLLEP